MPTPPISRKLAAASVRLVQQAVDDGFALSGSPSAVREACRRWNRKRGEKMTPHGFYVRYARAGELYGLVAKPKAKPGAKAPAGKARTSASATAAAAASAAELARDKVRGALKAGPKTLATLAVRTGLSIEAVVGAIEALRLRGVNVARVGDTYDIPPVPRASYAAGKPALELQSRPDNTFLFGAFGDLHAASKHTRWDVRADLIRRTEAAGAQAIFDTGNWIDGEARFNRYEIEVAGFEQQCKLLAQRHPKTALPIYAIAGDDHEGWYAQREGMNVGKYAEATMRDAGHNWTDLGFMESHVILKNANSGKTATLAVVHPGGGSAYALSYSIQKIVESYEGGEKPNVGLFGHYHKLWAGIIRNIWCVQTGCQQDQTPFMRKRRLEAHVGGVIVALEQDPRTGAIIAMTPQILRYFNKGYYRGAQLGAGDRWSHHGPVAQPKRSIEAIRT